MTVAESAKAIEEHLRQLRREFHRHPETSGNEKETAVRAVSYTHLTLPTNSLV